MYTILIHSPVTHLRRGMDHTVCTCMSTKRISCRVLRAMPASPWPKKRPRSLAQSLLDRADMPRYVGCDSRRGSAITSAQPVVRSGSKGTTLTRTPRQRQSPSSSRHSNCQLAYSSSQWPIAPFTLPPENNARYCCVSLEWCYLFVPIAAHTTLCASSDCILNKQPVAHFTLFCIFFSFHSSLLLHVSKFFDVLPWLSNSTSRMEVSIKPPYRWSTNLLGSAVTRSERVCMKCRYWHHTLVILNEKNEIENSVPLQLFFSFPRSLWLTLRDVRLDNSCSWFTNCSILHGYDTLSTAMPINIARKVQYHKFAENQSTIWFQHQYNNTIQEIIPTQATQYTTGKMRTLSA